MRTTMLLSFFLILTIGKLNSQILELGNKWIFDYRDYSIGNGFYTEKFDSIVIVSDSLINGKTYYKLIASEESPCGIFTSIEYLREENEKIYRLSNNLTNEYLLFDFTIQNSYPMTYQSSGFNTEIQTTVINDSKNTEILPSGEQIELSYQRILNNSSYNDDAVYKLSKDIGYIEHGLLFPDIGTGLCDVRQKLNLRCKISHSDTIRLTALDCHESSIVSSSFDVDSEEPTLYPNPSYGLVKIEGDFEIVSIKDISGLIFKCPVFKNGIDLSNLPKGTYFITVSNMNHTEIKTYKVIKM